MLRHLVAVHQPTNPFDFWPFVTGTPEGDRGYWYPPPARLLEIAGSQEVWPVISRRDQSILRCAALSEVLVVSGMGDGFVIASRSCSLPVVFSPIPVVALVKTSAKYARQLASLVPVYPHLQVSTSPFCKSTLLIPLSLVAEGGPKVRALLEMTGVSKR